MLQCYDLQKNRCYKNCSESNVTLSCLMDYVKVLNFVWRLFHKTCESCVVDWFIRLPTKVSEYRLKAITRSTAYYLEERWTAAIVINSKFSITLAGQIMMKRVDTTDKSSFRGSEVGVHPPTIWKSDIYLSRSSKSSCFVYTIVCYVKCEQQLSWILLKTEFFNHSSCASQVETCWDL